MTSAIAAVDPPQDGTPFSGVNPPETGRGGRIGIMARILIGLIRLYQAARSGRPSPCRFIPSCSTYAVEALDRHGALKGSWLAARRLSRCHPWGGRGADPVPQ